jgi:AraC-like DNA-binding protein
MPASVPKEQILSSTSSSVIYRSRVSLAKLHKNRVPCIIIGDKEPISVETPQGLIRGEAVYIAPDQPHRVHFGKQSSRTLYLESVRHEPLLNGKVARRFEDSELNWVMDAIDLWSCEQENAFLERFDNQEPIAPMPEKLVHCLEQLGANPHTRLSQQQLAQDLGLERTQALKLFKACTGMTLRSFQIWKAIRGALEDVAAGAHFQTAGFDNGFCDAAHFSRSFRSTFGMSLSQALDSKPTS